MKDRYIIVDLEATCWQKRSLIEKQEIIEIGAVDLNLLENNIEREFSFFVKPKDHPVLSDFCKTLTTIHQTDIDQAKNFNCVFEQFLNWIGPDDFTLCSWGIYDVKQFRSECQRHNLEFPETFNNHINLKRLYMELHDMSPGSVIEALDQLDLKFEGTHHRGIDDARNIAQIAMKILPLVS